MELGKQKILLADDHGVFIGGLSSLLENDDRFKVAGIASNGKEALKLLRKEEFDILILDVNMPVLDGLETLKILSKEQSEVKILVLTAYADKKLYKALIEAGAHGIMNKNDADDNLIQVLDKIVAGESYITSLNQGKEEDFSEDEYQKKLTLTRRETEVLGLVAQEMTSREIAEKLFISEETAKTHRKNIIKKLGVKGVAGLVKFAYRHNLIN